MTIMQKTIFCISIIINIVLCIHIAMPLFWSHRDLDGNYATKRGPTLSTPQGNVPGIQSSIVIRGSEAVFTTDYGHSSTQPLKGNISFRDGKQILVEFPQSDHLPLSPWKIVLEQTDLHSIRGQNGETYLKQ